MSSDSLSRFPAMSSGTAAAGSSSITETQVVDEIPEALNTILLMVVKNFFSNEHFLVVYHIMRAQCIREENLKARLQFDQKQLRQLLANLKLEKLVKERIITQKNENNRTVSIIFYYINYRAVLNVVKYKIDHMRQKLESREQMDTNRAHYKCNTCQSTYDMLDVSRILDPESGRLICWRCHGEVQTDETVVPSRTTRTAVARFNEQMNTLYSHICALNGIQLAPHLLEPDIAKYMEDDKAAQLQLQQQMDFTSGAGGQRIQLGGVAHSYHNAATINYANGDSVFVDLNADHTKGPVEEAKIIPEWLKDTAIGGEASHNDNVLDQATTEDDDPSTNQRRFGPSIDYLKEVECGDSENEQKPSIVKIEEPPAKQPKLEDGVSPSTQESISDDFKVKMEVDDEDVTLSQEEEECMIHVGGRIIPLRQVTPKMVEEEMNEREREEYCSVVQDLFALFFAQQCSVY